MSWVGLPRAPLVALLALVVVMAGLVGWLAFERLVEPSVSYATLPLHVGRRDLTLQVADTDPKRELGLGQRGSLPASQGMIFTYTSMAQRCFWMKDMHFSLDMLWLDSGKRIGHIERDVSPGTYPHAYCPEQPAQYVIELNAGQAGQLGLHDGQVLRF